MTQGGARKGSGRKKTGRRTASIYCLEKEEDILRKILDCLREPRFVLSVYENGDHLYTFRRDK